MNVRRLQRDDDAVSPVIGVVLMVAITVILAAVIASFVLGFSDERLDRSPQANIAFDYQPQSGGHDALTVTYEGGDTLDAANVNATVHGADQSSGDAVYGAEAGSGDDGKLFGDSGDVSAGATHVLDDGDFHDGGSSIGGNLDLSGATVNVVYEDPSGDSSTVLARWEGPDA